MSVDKKKRERREKKEKEKKKEDEKDQASKKSMRAKNQKREDKRHSGATPGQKVWFYVPEEKKWASGDVIRTEHPRKIHICDEHSNRTVTRDVKHLQPCFQLLK